MSEKQIDEVSGVETTGHEWDGIKELNNPLPRWWVWIFYATIIWAVGYMIYYPSIPLINTSTTGISGVTVRGNLENDLAEKAAARADIVSQIESSDLETIRGNEDLYRFSIAGGESLYKVYCSQCHGSGAQGAPGYPNLNDDDWLWGGDLESIYVTINHGVRNDQDDDARFSLMPAFGVDGILDPEEIRNTAEYVLQLSDQEFNAEHAALGEEPYLDNCAACHGEDGAGMRDLGAPNISDAIWLYGGERDDIIAQIQNPKHGVMPPWGDRLGDAAVKQLALYVHSRGGGEAEQSE